MYVKLFSSVLDSSVWTAPYHVRLVWITLLAMSDRDGIVRAAVPGIAHRARVTPEEGVEAMGVLSGPDPDSKDPANKGRRIERCPDGWIILNYERYRNTVDREDQREKSADRSQRYRDRKRDSSRSSVTKRDERDHHVTVTRVRHADADADADAEKKKTTPTPPRVGGFPDLPVELNTQEFKAAWERWVQHRKEIRHKLTTSTIVKQIQSLATLGATEAIARIDQSIEQGYQGLFQLKDMGQQKLDPKRHRSWDDPV